MLYTGDERHTEEEIVLSRAHFGGECGALEVRVKVLYGNESDSVFAQYVQFTRIYKEKRKQYGRTREAVLATIDECIERDVLREYFGKHRPEVISIMMALYDRETYMKMYDNSRLAEAHSEGIKEGEQKGRGEGMDLFGKLIGLLLSAGRTEDVSRAAADPAYRDQLIREFQLA